MAPPSPYDDPVPRGWKFVQGTLRVAVCMQCAGLALAHLSGSQDSGAAGLLQSLWDATGSAESGHTRLAGYGLAVAALFTLLRPSWPVLVCVVLWFGADAAAPLVDEWRWLAPLSGVLRVAMPLVLLLIDFWPPSLSFSIGRAQVSLALLRLALVISVTVGGIIKLLELDGGGLWSDVIRAAATTVGINLTDAQVAQSLAVMLAADIGLAWSALTSRNRLALAVLAMWLVASAALWIAAKGSSGYAAFLLDASAAGAPLAVLLFWICAVKEQPPVIVPG
ncbi:MAG: hypothetical protein U0992_00155 [Planctomycetaceae bacterium]